MRDQAIYLLQVYTAKEAQPQLRRKHRVPIIYELLVSFITVLKVVKSSTSS